MHRVRPRVRRPVRRSSPAYPRNSGCDHAGRARHRPRWRRRFCGPLHRGPCRHARREARARSGRRARTRRGGRKPGGRWPGAARRPAREAPKTQPRHATRASQGFFGESDRVASGSTGVLFAPRHSVKSRGFQKYPSTPAEMPQFVILVFASPVIVVATGPTMPVVSDFELPASGRSNIGPTVMPKCGTGVMTS
jgi:hypothetical protein